MSQYFILLQTDSQHLDTEQQKYQEARKTNHRGRLKTGLNWACFMGIVDCNGNNETFQRLLTEEAQEGAMMQCLISRTVPSTG